MGDEGFESMDVVVGAADGEDQDAPAFEPLQIDNEESPEEEQQRAQAELDEFARHACMVSKVLLTVVLVVFSIVIMKYNQQAASVKAADEAYFNHRALPKGKFRGNIALASTFDSIGLQLKLHPPHKNAIINAERYWKTHNASAVPLVDNTAT
jgi:hypothetical protein